MNDKRNDLEAACGQIGKIFQLKSGGPRMTIIDLDVDVSGAVVFTMAWFEYDNVSGMFRSNDSHFMHVKSLKGFHLCEE